MARALCEAQEMQNTSGSNLLEDWSLHASLMPHTPIDVQEEEHVGNNSNAGVAGDSIGSFDK
jgi:hypothetical protein